MNKRDMQTILQDLTEQKAPAARIDLWPAIQSRVQMSPPEALRGITMNTHLHSRAKQWKPAYILLAILLIGAVFLAFPQGRALAQEVMHFFTHGKSNIMSGVTVTPVKWVEQTPGVAAASATPQPPELTPTALAFEKDCGSPNTPRCSLDTIRSLASFPVYALGKLPAGMQFSGATGGTDRVFLDYRKPDQTESLSILEQPIAGASSQTGGEVGTDADIQSVQVGAVTAEYVKGSYNGDKNPPVWDNTIDLQMLWWVDHGLLFRVYVMGAGSHLGRDDLAALAATMTDGPVAENGQPMAQTETPASPEPTFDVRSIYPLTLAEAEKKAGVKLLSPSRLPETFTFTGAAYDEKTKVVKILYSYHIPQFPDAQGGLLVNEQLAPKGSDCDLCGFVQGTGKQVDQYPEGKLVSKDAAIETVQIGSTTGLYVEGIGWTSATDCCGWQWDSSPFRKKLRFQTHGLAIEIWMESNETTKADLITIAEGLQ